MSTTPSPTSSAARRQLMNDIKKNRTQQLGDKKFHSETSLQNAEDEDDLAKDPGVLNESVNGATKDSDSESARRRTMSQPGPVSGSLLTASAARAARKRPPRNVNYADPGKLDSNEKQGKYLSPLEMDINAMSDRASPMPYNGYRNGDARSLNSYRIYTSNNDLRGAATPRKRSVVTMDAQSIRSVETHAPPPTAPETKKQLTRECLTLSLSCTYAIMIVTLGLIIYLSDAFIETTIAPYYSIVLASIGILYMIFLVSDIERYKRTASKNQRIKSRHDETIEEYFRKQEMDMGEDSPGERTPEISGGRNLPGLPPPALNPLNHDYCFSQGRHSGSFYLKMGAAGFALGNLVHAVLLIAVQMAYYFDDSIDNTNCVDIPQMAFDFINPLFCFYQLYFIFKYSNVIILRYQGVARFAFMHYIGTSLCFWISAIVRETILGLTLYAQSTYGNENTGYSDLTRVQRSTTGDIYNRIFDVSGLYDQNCLGARAINSIYENFSPYMYPFSVEFNILIVAVYYIIWSNIGNCDKDNDTDTDGDTLYSDNNTVCKIPTANEENDFSSNIVIYADCHASNRGLFVGLIVTVITLGMLIIGFVFSSVGEEFLEIGYILNDCTKLFLHICMLLAAVIAFNQIRQMDINEHPISLLDDILLFICLPAFFLETTLSLVATINILNIIKSIDFVVMIIQVILQTSLIVDAIRRCSNTRKLRRNKPGREIIMFLLIANVAMWIFHTFSYKSPDSLDERYTYYGKVLWTILGHISLPLMMFYRFHSSVCFADIWDAAYKPGSEH